MNDYSDSQHRVWRGYWPSSVVPRSAMYKCFKHLFPCDCATQHDAGPAARATSPSPPAGRRFLGPTLAAGAMGGLGLTALTEQAYAQKPAVTMSKEARSMSPAQHVATPSEALAELIEGNRRYLKRELVSFKQDYERLRGDTAQSQSPFAAVLACADSRVPVELIFDQSIGQLYTVRVAGNVAAPSIVGSLEYAVEALNVKALLVLGHTQCGAVKAAMQNEDAPWQVRTLYTYMRPAIVHSPKADYAGVVMQNAIEQAKVLTSASPVVAQRLKTGALIVQPAVYDVATGKVELL